MSALGAGLLCPEAPRTGRWGGLSLWPWSSDAPFPVQGPGMGRGSVYM